MGMIKGQKHYGIEFTNMIMRIHYKVLLFEKLR